MSQPSQVLLVDDDRDILEGVRLRLHAAGYETMTACDGQQAIDSAIDQKPDAIVLDVRMPRMDGMTVLARLKEHQSTRHIPIVMLSASLVDQQAALEAGATFFVIKPYAAENLLAALDSALHDNRPSTTRPRRTGRGRSPLGVCHAN